MTKRFFVSAFLLGALLFFVTTRSASAVPQEPLDTIPFEMVASDVVGYTIAAPKLFWDVTHPVCPPTDEPAAADTAAENSELINRISIYGTEPRTLYDVDTGSCSIFNIRSEIIADNDYVYWIGPDGLMKLSVDANVGDEPTLMSTITPGTDIDLAIDNDYIYILKVTGSNPNYSSTIYRVSKNATPQSLIATLVTRSGFLRDLGVSHANLLTNSRNILYWIESGELKLYDLDEPTSQTPVSRGSNVVTYHAEGGRFICNGITCFLSDTVYFSTSSGDTHQLWSMSSGGTPSTNYTSSDRIYDIVTDSNNVYMLEENTIPCAPQPCFSSANASVTRRPRGIGTTDYLYISDPEVLSPPTQNLAISEDYLFWQEYDGILRLPSDAEALPLTNLRATGLSITQGIQKPDNSVILIEGRRTFVRVFAESDGPGNISGVTARLYRVDVGGNVLDYVLPVNDVGTDITVKTNPQRANLNDSFLFELPWDWLTDGLRLRAEVNPYHAPPQASYANNNFTAGPFNFESSPALKVNFVAWQYYANNQIYSPHLIDDIIHTYSWLIRAFPIASQIVFENNNDPGLHPNLWFVGDDKLDSLVDQTADECQDLLTDDDDDRNLCASRYTNQQMVVMRAGANLPESRFFYGMISDELAFPRGQACCGTAVSSGPVGPPGASSWDTDATYGDWYAGHEIAHTLGRAHPTPNGDNPNTEAIEGCGHSRSDPNYPYVNAQIGTNANSEGFDVGDPSLGLPRRVYPSNMWFDVMSYCPNQWVSDYTYEGMYNFMMANLAADGSPIIEGDFLVVAGMLFADGSLGSIQQLQRTDNNAVAPNRIAGDYAIRLLDGQNVQLASYPFTPSEAHEIGEDAFHILEAIPFVSNTRSVQIVRLNDGLILATQAVSAAPPTVSNVSLNGATEPVTGTVTLSWSAADPDGDPLTYSIYYSPDNGSTLQAVAQGLSTTTAEIDTSMLGGGTEALFRVIASDGANTGSGDSPLFEMANKAPVPMIFLPGPTTTIQYGQLVNFSGGAIDYQDGGVSGSTLVWRLNGERDAIGTGSQISVDDLPVGTNIITLTAINDDGLFASAEVTVIVEDDLSLLPPTLTAGPTQFGWQFAAESTTPQAFTLNIGNAGSGEIEWELSSDVDWLTTDIVSGTNSVDVQLTVDPSQLEDGTAEAGTLTLTTTALNPTQTILIPVSYAKGYTPYNPPGQPAPQLGLNRILLPFILQP